jgi:hypothetical protein
MFPLIIKAQRTMLLWRIGAFFCDVKFIVGLPCILPLFDYMHTLIKIERGRCHDFNLGVVSKIKAWDMLWSKECPRIQTQASPNISNWLSHFGDWNFILSQIFGIKIDIKRSKFKLLKRSLSVGIKNGLSYFIWTSKTQVMTKRLIKIKPTPLCVFERWIVHDLSIHHFDYNLHKLSFFFINCNLISHWTFVCQFILVLI